MNISRQLERLSRLHQLLSHRNTGPPDRLCRRLGISRSQLYLVISELKDYGAVIAYCRKEETFYYENDFLVEIRCTLRPLSPCETESVAGGCRHFMPVPCTVSGFGYKMHV